MMTVKHARGRGKWLHMALVAAVLAGLALAAEHLGQRHLSQLLALVRQSGGWGPLVLVAANALGVMLLLPQVIFTVVAGMLFGPVLGTAYSLAGMACGASLGFWGVRGGLRGRIEPRLKGNPLFDKLQRISRDHPLHMVVLARLLVPFPLASYLLGMTQVRFVPFVLLTVAAMLPETLFLTTGGHLLRLGVTGEHHGQIPWPLVAVLVVAGGVLVVLIRRATRKLAEDESASQGAERDEDR